MNAPGPCFTYGGSGHRAAEYANNRMSCQKHDKAMMATWSDSEHEDSVCFDMSSDDEENVVAFVALSKKFLFMMIRLC